MDSNNIPLGNAFSSFITEINNVTNDWRISVATNDDGCFNNGVIDSQMSNYERVSVDCRVWRMRERFTVLASRSALSRLLTPRYRRRGLVIAGKTSCERAPSCTSSLSPMRKSKAVQAGRHGYRSIRTMFLAKLAFESFYHRGYLYLLWRWYGRRWVGT